jgi:pimeloyl-ACP methyl ester carboxylesterase
MQKIVPVFVLIVAFATPAGSQLRHPPLPDLTFAPIGARDKFLGDRWSYMEAGRPEAPALVLLHGVGGNSMDWRYQLEGLSDQYHVIAWNAPGYVLSDGLKAETPSCIDYADALADLLDALKLGRVNLVGNSFGSRVAQCFSMHHPDRLMKMALLGPSAGPHALTEAQKAATIAAREAQIANGGYGFGGRADALVGPKTSAELLALVRNGARATNPRGFMQGIRFGLTDGYSPDEVAAKVRAPVLMIAGSDDHVSPIPTNAALLKQAIPSARLDILQEIGHLPHLEAPERVNELLREFFGQ